nr:O-antigen ligase family protein [Candidatus Omnitrophota bacterium]
MEIYRFINLGLIFYITVNFIIDEKDIKSVLNLILAAGVCVSIFGILQYLGVIGKSWWDNPKFLSATYVNHNHFAGYLELLIPIPIGMILFEKETYKKVLYVCSVLILSIAFLLSMSRGGWFALSISMVFMAIVMFRKGRARFIIFISTLIFITLMIFAFKAIDTSVLLRRISSYKELDFAGRLEIWKGTFGIIKDNLILGTGPGSFIYNFPRYRPAGLNMFVNYAHSDYLQIASEIGILASGIFIFAIWTVIKKGLETHAVAHRSFKVWIPLSLSTGILSLAIHNIGDFNFYIPANAIIFTVFSGFLYNISSLKEAKYKYMVFNMNPVQSRFFRALALIIAGLAIVCMGFVLAAEGYLKLSDKAIAKNDLKSAEYLTVAASKLNPFNSAYAYKLADIYSRAGLLDKAKEKYEQAIYLNSMDSRSWIGLGDTYYNMFKAAPMDYKLRQSADAAYKKALGLDPLNANYLKRFADFLLNTPDPGLSSEVYKKASYIISKTKIFSLVPVVFTDPKSYNEVARLAFSSGNINKAMVFYEMAEGFEKNNQEAKLGQVRCYMKASLMKKALDKYRELRPSKHAKSTLFASLAEYCLNRDLIESADTFADNAISLDQKNPEGFQSKYKILKNTIGSIDRKKYFINILDLNKFPIMVSDSGLEVRLDVKGRLYKEETISQEVILPAGMYELNIEAKGEKAQGVGPHMIVRFNCVDIMEVYVDSSDWTYYQGIIVVDYPVNSIDIIYDNDYYDAKTKEDRNLSIGSLKLKVL